MLRIHLIFWAILNLFAVCGSAYGGDAQPLALPSDSHANEPIECFHSAVEWGLSFHQSILLCTNSKSQDPFECYRHLFEPLTLGVTPDQKINLCQGATSQAPVKCFEESINLVLTIDQRTKLCNTAVFSTTPNQDPKSTAPYHCYTQSIVRTLPLTQDERIILCADADSDDPVLCFSRADILTLSFDQRVRLCTLLPPPDW